MIKKIFTLMLVGMFTSTLFANSIEHPQTGIQEDTKMGFDIENNLDSLSLENVLHAVEIPVPPDIANAGANTTNKGNLQETRAAKLHYMHNHIGDLILHIDPGQDAINNVINNKERHDAKISYRNAKTFGTNEWLHINPGWLSTNNELAGNV